MSQHDNSAKRKMHGNPKAQGKPQPRENVGRKIKLPPPPTKKPVKKVEARKPAKVTGPSVREHTSQKVKGAGPSKSVTKLPQVKGKNPNGVQKPSNWRPGPILPGEVSALILEDLTRNHSDICNFFPEAACARKGDIYLAYCDVKAKCEQLAETSARHVWVKAQALAALKKTVDSQYDRWPQTKAMWFSDEHTCKRTNQKLDAWVKRWRNHTGTPLHVDAEYEYGGVRKELPFVREMMRFMKFVHYIVGDQPPMNEILCSSHHGPGSTVTVGGSAVHYVAKSGALDCMSGAVELAAESLVYDKGMWERLGFDPAYSHLDSAREGFIRAASAAIRAQLVTHDELLFVHKGLESLRSIGKQATLNVLVQLGVDPVIKANLKTLANIDLHDQSVNQALAYQGSKHWSDPDPWCTLDKSSASNLIARNLIPLGFPASWSKLLWRLRSPRYLAPDEIGGGIHEYQMYAGMGNGTTFAVESLIFAAIAFATSDLRDPADVPTFRVFSVYGDDVIVRRSHVDKYIAFAEFLGFRMNMEKSCFEGPFRESCGADFWNGENVRPAYVKCESPVMHELELIGLHNTLMDQPNWQLLDACRGIRKLFAERIHQKIPTDHQGNLGFRPEPGLHGYSIVRKNDGTPMLSPAWQRVRYYVYNVRPRLDRVGDLTPWLSFMVALQKGTQLWGTKGGSSFALPYRNLVNIRMEAEVDMRRDDLVTMLKNQLRRLASHKAAPWFKETRGQMKDGK